MSEKTGTELALANQPTRAEALADMIEREGLEGLLKVSDPFAVSQALIRALRVMKPIAPPEGMRPGQTLLENVRQNADYWLGAGREERDSSISFICAEQAVNAWKNAAYTMAEKFTVSDNELERERLRLAACGTAALGYFKGCNDEYKSASLTDVLGLRARADELQGRLDLALEWTDEDKPLPEDELIGAAHPEESGDDATYAEALRMVSAKRSKGALVDLVNWLLRERVFLEEVTQACRRSTYFARFMDAGFWSAHHLDLHWRIEGKDITEQADWLVAVWYAVRRRIPGRTPSLAVGMSSGALTGGAGANRA